MAGVSGASGDPDTADENDIERRLMTFNHVEVGPAGVMVAKTAGDDRRERADTVRRSRPYRLAASYSVRRASCWSIVRCKTPVIKDYGQNTAFN